MIQNKNKKPTMKTNIINNCLAMKDIQIMRRRFALALK